MVHSIISEGCAFWQVFILYFTKLLEYPGLSIDAGCQQISISAVMQTFGQLAMACAKHHPEGLFRLTFLTSGQIVRCCSKLC